MLKSTTNSCRFIIKLSTATFENMEAIPNQVDQKTLDQLATGSVKAFEDVMDCYFTTVYCIGKQRLGSEQLAENVATQVFAAVWKRQAFQTATELKEFIAATYCDAVMKLDKSVLNVLTYSRQE